MKTSNKLFGLVILLVLVLPLLVAAFLLKSIREEAYTIRDSTSQKISRGTYNKPYKTLKIVAPAPNILHCYFLPADSNSMKYTISRYLYESGRDSVRIYNSGDTLYVKYDEVSQDVKHLNDRQASSGKTYRHMNVNLHLSSFDDIVVDGGQVKLDSLWQPAKFKLINQGTLMLAKTGNRTVTRKSVVTTGGDGMTMVPLDSTYSGDFKKLSVTADNSTLSIGDYAWVRDIELDLRGSSHLTIDTTARIDQITGAISPETKLNALPGMLRKLTPLIAKEDEAQ